MTKAQRASGLFTSRGAQIAALYDQHSTVGKGTATIVTTGATPAVNTTATRATTLDSARTSDSDFASFALHARQPALVPAECLPPHRRPQQSYSHEHSENLRQSASSKLAPSSSSSLLSSQQLPSHALALTITARRRQHQATIDLDTHAAFTVGRPPTRTALMAARKAAAVATGEQYLDARRLLLGLK